MPVSHDGEHRVLEVHFSVTDGARLITKEKRNGTIAQVVRNNPDSFRKYQHPFRGWYDSYFFLMDEV